MKKKLIIAWLLVMMPSGTDIALGGDWSELQSPGPGYLYHDIFFVDSSHGCVVAEDHASSRQAVPSLAVDNSGNMYVAWEDERNGNKDIYFAKSIDQGLSWSSHVRVNSGGLPNHQYSPSLVVDGTGSSVYIVWHDNRNGVGDEDVFFSESLDAGDTWVPEVMISDGIPGTAQREASLAIDDAGDLYLAWSDGSDGASDYIYFKKRTGGFWGPAATLIDSDKSCNGQDNPALTVDDSNGVFLAWQGMRDNLEVDIYFSHSSDGGTNWSDETRVDQASAGTFQVYPAIYIQGDNVYVVWQDSRSISEALFCAKSDKTSILFDSDVRVDDGSAAVLKPALTGDGTRLYAAWSQGVVVDSNIMISTSLDGVSWSVPKTRIDDDAGGNRSYPSVAVDSTGRVFAAWRDERNPNNDDIYSSVSLDQGSSWSQNTRLKDPDYKTGVIFCTWDGAVTPWVAASLGMAQVPPLWKVFLASDLIGWAVGDQGVILYTSDGGSNWSQQTWVGRIGDEQLRSVFFIDATTGWIVGPAIVLSTNDASTWSLEPSLLYGQNVAFITSERGWAVCTAPEVGRTVFETNGATINWIPVSSLGSALFGISAVADDNVWVAGDGGVLEQYYGGDPDTDWHQAVLPGGSDTADLRDVDIPASQPWVGWSVGSESTIVHTPDDGASWIADNIIGPAALFLEAVSVVDWNFAWATGNDPDAGGRILTYTCFDNADCDDGLTCNGPETCTPPCLTGTAPLDGSSCELACSWCQSEMCEPVPAGQDPFADCSTCQVCNGGGGCENATDDTDPKGECTAGGCDDCYGGVCAPDPGTCLIAGSCYNQGEQHPTNDCLVCEPSTDPSDWTPVTDGTACGVCQWCQSGSCDAVAAQQDPFADCSTCQVCDGGGGCENATDDTDPKGECTAGGCDDCYGGACAPDSATCLITGICYNQGDHHPTNDCLICEPSTDASDWTTVTNGTACGVCQWCQSGLCESVAAQQDPFADCSTCQVCNGGGACENAAGNTDPKGECTAGGCDDCYGGVCAPDPGTCLIAGTCYNQGEHHPTNDCLVCEPSTSSSGWTTVTNGTACGVCQWCQSGSCDAVATQQDPLGDCSTCQVCNGAGGCENAADDTDPKGECTAGVCDDCYGGACAPDPDTCLIAGNCFNHGVEQSGNPCLFCDANQDASNWTEEIDDTYCGDCSWCKAGYCDPVPTNQDPNNECEQLPCQPGYCNGSRSCTLDPIDTPCGDPGNSPCDLPDSCDQNGQCQQNYVTEGEGTCGGGCHPCNGVGECDPLTNLPNTMTCQDPASCSGICMEGTCMVEAYCDQPVEGCGFTSIYGTGEGQTLNCRLPEDKVTLRLYTDLSLLESCRLLPIRIEMINHDQDGWSKPLHELELLLRINPDQAAQESRAELAYAEGSAVLQWGQVSLEVTGLAPDQVIFDLGDESSQLPVTESNQTGWVLDLMLLFTPERIENPDFEISVWAPCLTQDLGKIGCHHEWNWSEEVRLPDRQLVSRIVPVGDVEEVLQPPVGCHCGTRDPQGALSGLLWLVVFGMLRRFFTKRAR